MGIQSDKLGVTSPLVIPWPQVAGVVLGNALEFFDFLGYAYFAVYIGRTFFPSSDPTTSLLASLATFGAGFLTRPLGALVLGRLGDRVGRRAMLQVTFTLMGLAMLGLGLTPSYSTIGIAAPILAIFFRLTQGFAVGGEIGAGTAYLAEAAPPHRRGFYISFQYMSQDASTLLIGLMGVLLSSALSDSELTRWGWRLPFLFGATIIPVGLYLRRSIVETLDVSPELTAARPRFGGYRRIAFLGFAILSADFVLAYIVNYLTTYSLDTLKMPAIVAFGATVTQGVCGLIFDPIAGLLSDRVGRKPVMRFAYVSVLVSALPAFLIISYYRSPLSLYVGTAVLAITTTFGANAILIWVTESLPKLVRCGSLALIFSLAGTLFGGSTQFVVTWLIKVTGSPLAPAWYTMGATAVGLLAMLMMRESAPSKQTEFRPAMAPA